MKMPFHIGKSPAKKTGTTNKSGAILALVVIVLVIVNTLGVGLLSQSAMNAIEVVKKVQSNQAFWVAEGGLGMAISNLPDTNSLGGTLGNGEYDVNSTLVPEFLNRWTIESVGSVNIATRRIRAVVVVTTEVTTAIMVSGDLSVLGAAVDINGVVAPNTPPYFEDIFGVTKEEMQDYATYEYTNPPNNETPVEQITWVNEDGEFQITEDVWVGNGIMVIDGDLRITGGRFNGIIWVIGELYIGGNAEINGSIFVEGEVTEDTTIAGTAKIFFDQSAIDGAFSNLNNVLLWEEF